MNPNRDPAQMTSEELLQEIAELFAEAYTRAQPQLRLVSQLADQGVGYPSSGDKTGPLPASNSSQAPLSPCETTDHEQEEKNSSEGSSTPRRNDHDTSDH